MQTVKLETGQLYSFRIFEFDESEYLDTKHYGILKILDPQADDGQAVCAVALEYYDKERPTLQQAKRLPVQMRNRNSFNNSPAVLNIPMHFKNDLREFTLLGKVGRLTTQEKKMSQQFGVPIGLWLYLGIDAYYEWRWEHDREAFMLDVTQRAERQAQKRRDAEIRQKTRLRRLTWDMLLAETQFPEWDDRTLVVPEEYTKDARQEIRSTIHDLKKLGPKPALKDVRSRIKQCVEWFNKADGKYGYWIETEEREDIYLVLEELTYIARQKIILNEVDQWRQW